ncbi:MAG: DUF4905 domain-containing protein [Ignavibacteria bacterium]
MKLFDKNKLKIFWSFSQSGNIWKFIFGGDKYIIGETRDTINKKLYLFSLDFNTGKVFLRDHTFESENFWVSIEGANENIFFLGRFENPKLPYQKNIIALDIETGQKVWENDKYSYLLNTDKQLFGIKKKFESNEISEIDIMTGRNLKTLSEDEHLTVFELRNNNEDFLYENSNYPIKYIKSDTEDIVNNAFALIFNKEKNVHNIEYIKKGSLLIFNYYINLAVDSHNNERILYENKFMIYDMMKESVLFEDILNRKTNYCVPDNFFIKNNYLFYLKEMNLLNCIKLNLE